MKLSFKYMQSVYVKLYTCHTLIPYLCRMATLRLKPAGGAHRGSPQDAVMEGLSMSHNGRQRFSSNSPATVQARHGQHQKP